jgi:hypothetical protein
MMGARCLCILGCLWTLTGLKAAPTQPCTWTFSSVQGVDEALAEMSGLAISRSFPERYYHINDSGNAAEILQTDAQGRLQRRVAFAKGVFDTEDLSLGPCATPQEQCLYVADTGDNIGFRSRVRIYRFPESSLDQASLTAPSLEIVYPGGAFDVESMAVHPLSGEIYLFSKKDRTSRIFRIDANAWASPSIAKAEHLTTLPYGPLTGAAFSPDGKRLALISWRGVQLFSSEASPGFVQQKDLAAYPWLQQIKVPPLSQIEAIAFHPDGHGFTYTSEKKRFSKTPWGMISARCKH